MKKIMNLLVLLIIFLLPIICNAKEDVEIKSITIDSKTEKVEQLEEPSIDDLNVKVQAKFKNVEDSIKYKIVLTIIMPIIF